MNPVRVCLTLLIVACWTLDSNAQKSTPSEAILYYKDGFSLKGRLNEKVGKFIFDPASGRSFPQLSGVFYIDDRVRNILFSPGQILRPEEIKSGLANKATAFERIASYRQNFEVNPIWELEKVPEWTKHCDRTIQVSTPNGRLEMLQQIGLITPHYILAITKSYRWNPVYFTREFTPELTREMLLQIMSERKKLREMPDHQKLLLIAAFMQEAGWYTEAERELTRCITSFPQERKTAQDRLNQIKEIRTNLFAESIKQASSAGQHQEAIARLETFEKENFQKVVSPDNRLAIQDAKSKYEKAKSDLKQARSYLERLPDLTKTPGDWSSTCKSILADLNFDTIGRLETFLTFARQHENDIKNKRKPTQTSEEVLAIAVTGWLQGNQAAEPDPKMALKLAHARKVVLEYLKTDDADARKNLVSTLKNNIELPTDVIVRLIRMIPPSHPLDATKSTTEMMTMPISAGAGGDGSYLVQLPPEYHPLRSYPVVLLLNSSREGAELMLSRFTEEAAKRGFILAAPLRTGNTVFKTRQQPSEKDHITVMNTLRDLRRRFQIDSDRIFLFGWEDGADLAFDVALGHPDLLAGVVPMCGTIPPLTRRHYWTNAQYLPFYIIEGERNGSHAKVMRDLFRDWTRQPFAATYVEYKGRTSEWFSAEIPLMFNWMSQKKRHYPVKEMGRAGATSGQGEEFRSTREMDNRFYWLSSDAIADRCLSNHGVASWPPSFRPATFQANFSLGNETDSKKAAKIWNQMNVRVSGLKQVTLWITPNMMDFSKPLSIRVNGEQVGPMRVIQPQLETLLEELFSSGDRQRLTVAKLDIKL